MANTFSYIAILISLVGLSFAAENGRWAIDRPGDPEFTQIKSQTWHYKSALYVGYPARMAIRSMFPDYD